MVGGFRDTLNLLSSMTGTRLLNATKIFSSYYTSRIARNARISGLPISVSIEPTTSCNLRCPECPSGLRSFTRATGMLDSVFFKEIIDQLSPTLAYLTFYFQGEPYLNPRFHEMVEYASSKGIYTATSTNGHYLTKETAEHTILSGLDRLIISIDGVTQSAYQAYRVGGSLEKVIAGAAEVVRLKKQLKSTTPHVVFQFLVVGPNEHEIPEVEKLARQVGVDQVVLKTAQIYNYEKGSPLMPRNPRFSRYHRNPDGTWSPKNSLDNHCWKMWHSCVITWDGKVVPCCFDKDAAYVMGDLSKQNFSDIWNGDKYEAFRKTLLGSRKEIEICQNCTEGTRVFA